MDEGKNKYFQKTKTEFKVLRENLKFYSLGTWKMLPGGRSDVQIGMVGTMIMANIAVGAPKEWKCKIKMILSYMGEGKDIGQNAGQ